METLYDAYCTAQRSGAALVAHVRRQGLKKHQIARDFRITQKEADLYIWLGHQFTAKLLMLAAEKQLSVSQLQVVAKAANKASANLVDKQALRQEFINHAATCTVDELHLYVNTRVLEVNSGRAPRKAATGISKQADADGMGHIHAAMRPTTKLKKSAPSSTQTPKNSGGSTPTSATRKPSPTRSSTGSPPPAPTAAQPTPPASSSRSKRTPPTSRTAPSPSPTAPPAPSKN